MDLTYMDLESAQRFIDDTLQIQKPCVCQRCGYEWKPRVTYKNPGATPRQCPQCHSYNWSMRGNPNGLTLSEKQHLPSHKIAIAVPILSIILSQHFLNKGYAASITEAQELATELVDYILSIVEG